jgi:hypothetical protein
VTAINASLLFSDAVSSVHHDALLPAEEKRSEISFFKQATFADKLLHIRLSVYIVQYLHTSAVVLSKPSKLLRGGVF